MSILNTTDGAGAARTVALFGLFGVGNVGNEASLDAAIAMIRDIDSRARVVCLGTNPDAITELRPVEAHSYQLAAWFGERPPARRLARLLTRPLLEPARWVGAWRFLRTVDLVVVPGTGILDDFGMRPWQMPYELLRWSLMARATRTRLAFVAVGAGPISGRLSRRFLRRAVGCSDTVSFRDEGSRSYMAGIGRDVAGDAVVPDIVFGLPATDGPGPDRGATVEVGLGVMTYYGWSNDAAAGEEVYARYLDDITEFGRRLLAAGHSIRVLVGETNDERARRDVVERLSAGAGAGGAVTSDPISTFDDLRRQIRSTDVVVATRFHNIVASILEGRPALSVGYAAKNDELLAACGLGDFVQHVDHLDVDRLEDQFADLVARRDELNSRLRRLLPDYHRRVRDELEAVLAGGRDDDGGGRSDGE